MVKKCEAEYKKIILISCIFSQKSQYWRKKTRFGKPVDKLDLQERKNNVLLHGISETGPTENIEAIVAKFTKEILKIPESENLCVDMLYRMGKPPHLLPAPVKNPRVIMVKFKNFEDKQKLWQARHNLWGTKFSVSEELPMLCNRGGEQCYHTFSWYERQNILANAP